MSIDQLVGDLMIVTFCSQIVMNAMHSKDDRKKDCLHSLFKLVFLLFANIFYFSFFEGTMRTSFQH